MEERGDRTALQCRQYSASCREFSVRCQPVQLRSLSAATCSVWLAAYWLFVLTQNSMVLSTAIFITLIGLIVYLHFVKIDQESLLVIASLGIQMTSSYASGKENTTFIEMSRVKDVVINEAICMQKVIYYLCILLRDPLDPQSVSEVVPLFQQRPRTMESELPFPKGGCFRARVQAHCWSSKPRLNCLVEVYRSCQEILEQRKTVSQTL
ncbi:phosphatidylinositol N-acetylglucosaminyltransferase subunit H isoform X1 [Alligator mississippiensis]|uniref:Phosphatidylinositol N-acetylglucosaminyltransferase subunit H isoform A n=1 Tax=Alligator mississippiensis TaxID=8496 RepID=A0A151MB23_ALLMI|nr:phosphatidylinositol N-acetylglucosaminyltransferase subunit H isoform X1 [Alligator mississippiensis]KYO21701.1 phosphatidylinositol N-acetylglucosaminyltransferase subunit H isoform A [Alligator mississippiensis]